MILITKQQSINIPPIGIGCYGYLYNFYVVDDSRELTSSADWTVPTNAQYNSLFNYISDITTCAYELRATGLVYWTDSNGTDDYGFRWIGSGNRNSTSGVMSGLNTSGSIWTSTESSASGAYYVIAQNTFGDEIRSITNFKKWGSAVRLIKDATGLADGVTTTYTGNDGKTYNAVVINELYWTTQNLEETQYRNGDPIPNVTDNTTWEGLTTGALCLYDNNTDYACKTPLPDTIGCFDIETANLTNTFSVADKELLPTCVTFNNVGTKMYVGGLNDDILEYNLSIAWDVSTAVYSQLFDASTQESNVRGVSFKTDGTKMYITGSGTDYGNEYDLSVAWDVTTATYLQRFDFNPPEANPADIIFSRDGKHMYMVGSTSDSIYHYILSTAWDISTATASGSLYIGSIDASPNGVYISIDGTSIWWSGSGTNQVHQYALSTAYDVTTASFVKSFSTQASVTGFTFNPNGAKLYTIGLLNDAVYEYTLCE